MSILGINLDVKQDLKQDLQQAQRLPGRAVKAVASDVRSMLPDRLVARPELPAYTRLDAAQLAAARDRSAGLTVPQPSIADKNGHLHEPINLLVTGSPAELSQALQRAGWRRADNLTVASGFRSALTLATRVVPALGKLIPYNYQTAPVSEMALNGRPFAMAFEKNNAHDTGRDHLRVFDSGQTDAQGRPIWAVAATRDTGLTIEFKRGKGFHQIDRHIDGERDMVMADLLKSSGVATWQVAQGQMSAADRQRVSQSYQTDGQVYQVDLTPRPGLIERLPQPSRLGEWLEAHTPGVIRQPLQGLHAKLLKFFQSTN